MKRRWLIPEVIQTSGMDCGPACLAALLRGFGISASYGRLREACQTGVDGTSIDTIEEIAIELGLEASQMILPLDHLLLEGHPIVPGIAVTLTPGGVPHFVVLWSRAFGRVQLMDPGRGRRWVRPEAFERELFVHQMEVPAVTWRAWAETEEFRAPLTLRLRALGISDAEARVESALADPEWGSIAALDAATRMTQDILRGGGAQLGAEAAQVLEALAKDPSHIPPAYTHARAAPPDADGVPQVMLRGAVLVGVRGAHPAQPVQRELRAALTEPPPQPWRALIAAMRADGALRPAALVVASLLGAFGVVVEASLFRATFEIGSELVTLPQRAIALGALIAFLLAMLLLEAPARAEALRLGRRTELRLRVALLSKLPRLGLHYLRSRPVSDMAERGHILHRLRELPPLGVRLLRAMGEIAVTTAALIALCPSVAPLAIALALAAIVPPFLAAGALAERELRMRTYAGALARSYLDALLGTLPARATGAESALRREHEGLLVEWSRASRAEHGLASGIALIQALLGFGLAIALVASQADVGGPPASLLLLVYWALAIPTTGQLLTAAVREIPLHLNTTLRLLEPLGALDDEAAIEAAPASAAGAAITMESVRVVAGGHTILEEISLRVRPGEHLAIVGRSGGGKSTLLGLLLGWSRPAEGTVRIDDRPLDAAALAALRASTAWIDPAVTLWNSSLASNLSYGVVDADVAQLAADAGLESTIARLPDGLSTLLGEGGGLVSGGEGQRVRLGRGLAKQRPRLAILDEPFRGLDREVRRAQLWALRQRWERTTFLCATHDLAETADFPRVLVVEEGRIVEDGSPAELAARPGSRYAALVASEERAAIAWSKWSRVRLAEGRVEAER
ncbi:MAG: ATP-binding cassette domain-containing protein [Myxococcota bacterium]